jgi:cell division protein ZapE
MAKSLLDLYNNLVKSGKIQPDEAQYRAAERLSAMQSLISSQGNVGHPHSVYQMLLAKLRFSRKRKVSAPQGIYLYGGVGVGKSMLMDLLASSMSKGVKRLHFHELMQHIHNEIYVLQKDNKRRKAATSIALVAKKFTVGLTLLCLDEMEVRDIADAMIVSGFFSCLLELGVVVVTTSNRHPDDLYKDGLQRQKFVPFINLIKSRLDLIKIKALKDYRRGRILGGSVYYSPVDSYATSALDIAWNRLTDDAKPEPKIIIVKGRKLLVPAAAHNVARFSFTELCESPLGAGDYLELGEHFGTIIIDGVKALGPENRDVARRFVTLVDALYECRTILICSAETAPESIYSGDDWSFEFSRTVSRMIEMQAVDYVSQSHLSIIGRGS